MAIEPTKKLPKTIIVASETVGGIFRHREKSGNFTVEVGWEPSNGI